MKKFQLSGCGFAGGKYRWKQISKASFAKPENSCSKLQSGFTLLEVVVAMAIVGIGVVSLLELFSAGLRLATASSARTDAVAYSRQAVDAFLVRKSFDGRGESGTFSRSLRWQIDVDPVRDDSQQAPANWQVSEITLRLSYPEAERDKLFEMKTLRIVKKKRE
jgi:prepilin-type N-terminal cleavage/methylation domain-containing protein